MLQCSMGCHPEHLDDGKIPTHRLLEKYLSRPGWALCQIVCKKWCCYLGRQETMKFNSLFPKTLRRI